MFSRKFWFLVPISKGRANARFAPPSDAHANAPPKVLVWWKSGKKQGNLGKICENLCKIPENLGELFENTSKNGAQRSTGFRGGQGARAQASPPKRAPHRMHVFSHIFDMCVPLVIFSKESLFVDAISVGQTAVFYLNIIWYVTKQLLHLWVSWK